MGSRLNTTTYWCNGSVFLWPGWNVSGLTHDSFSWDSWCCACQISSNAGRDMWRRGKCKHARSVFFLLAYLSLWFFARFIIPQLDLHSGNYLVNPTGFIVMVSCVLWFRKVNMMDKIIQDHWCVYISFKIDRINPDSSSIMAPCWSGDGNWARFNSYLWQKVVGRARKSVP